ncbi:hypothetical protein [Phaeodactylibacter xiamenensis]|uniref:hypothetical protein n=1 Tax=Phaeodactylibacter xiamenensis TaxID=1524460 RepID=UPI0024A8A146|nr:hypothetical protein [Phaeodactylibacter xiamenensis]
MKKNEDQLSMKNLGMIKMHPGTIRELRKMYEEYEKSLPEGEHKLDKSEFFGQHYEKVMSAYSDLYAKHKLQQAQLENVQSAYQAAEDIEGGEQERSQADPEEEEINILHRQIRKLEKRLDKAQNGGEINWYAIGAAGVAILFAIGAVYIALQIRKKVKNDE